MMSLSFAILEYCISSSTIRIFPENQKVQLSLPKYIFRVESFFKPKFPISKVNITVSDGFP